MYDDRFYGPTKFSASPVVGIELDKKCMTSPSSSTPHSALPLLTISAHSRISTLTTLITLTLHHSQVY